MEGWLRRRVKINVYTQHNGKNIPVGGVGLRCGMQGTCHRHGIIRAMKTALPLYAIVIPRVGSVGAQETVWR
jgi:hypothetical protein